MKRETRSETITRHVQAYLRATATSWPTLAADVSEQYAARVAQRKRAVHFHEGGDAYKDMRANAQLLKRFMEGEARLPVDLEEAIAYALPEPHRRELVADLAARYGLLHVAAPDADRAQQVQDAGEWLREVGEATEALGALLGDCRIDGADSAADLARARAELHDVIGKATGLVAAIDQALAEQAVQRGVRVVK
ncbi:hypothetical protein [Thioalbus denitrificans]|uniref:Uncharacterized protein n=1 Tax=Thioalbus denitrificans TaxID=547122 RepID=A0A369CDL7_9GAMM|nr:hypothetical protein [Thioalbus denitrificans]RCX32100.1 hypothetical protein DFQ59_102453 [Thioalbus denitrificans]